MDDDPRRFGFHNLRHIPASFLIRIRTDPKTVQTLLRHSGVKMTLQSYTHAVSRDRMVAAGKMLTAILSHAPDKNGLKVGCERVVTASHVKQGLGPLSRQGIFRPGGIDITPAIPNLINANGRCQAFLSALYHS